MITTFPSTLIIGHSYLLTGTSLTASRRRTATATMRRWRPTIRSCSSPTASTGAVYYLKTQDFSTLWRVTCRRPDLQRDGAAEARRRAPTTWWSIANGIPSAPHAGGDRHAGHRLGAAGAGFGGGQVAGADQPGRRAGGVPAGAVRAGSRATSCPTAGSPMRRACPIRADSRRSFARTSAITYHLQRPTASGGPDLPGPQRVQFPFQVSFTDDSIFTDPPYFPAGVKPPGHHLRQLPPAERAAR